MHMQECVIIQAATLWISYGHPACKEHVSNLFEFHSLSLWYEYPGP